MHTSVEPFLITQCCIPNTFREYRQQIFKIEKVVFILTMYVHNYRFKIINLLYNFVNGC